MIEQHLVEAGYKKYPTDVLHPNAEALYQKCIKDSLGKKYFINAYCYEADIQYEVQFWLDENAIDMILSSYSIDRAEGLFELMWTSLALDYVEKY